MDKALEEYQNKAIKLAVIGNSGVGKSSFINALRGLENNDAKAAKTGAIETTMAPHWYPYPKNPLITLWDLPGIGSTKYPDLKVFCKTNDLKEYDEFVIITATRFTENDVKLAKKLKSISKPFLFIRTKIDIDCKNEEKKALTEEELLKKIKENCFINLKGLLLGGDSDIYLISNNHRNKWDFPRLVEAILNKLPLDKQVCFTFSMYIVSESILKEKVKRLRGLYFP
ncbi:interferon-inducible GTPase 5-like [Paramuricea clavata]|uniref:Interferon-inducible GTPase 5-like n=1 Tax=Paramuricea clavata TaxID=317549 RepID=A0A6S7JC63_PARCT|nr:interferon-inducible GTPase 5-like [Paramuricea clavata]